MTVKQIDYPCGCWLIFNVDDIHNWKLVDFLICDSHAQEILI